MAGQVTLDKDECIGCEACVELCPEVFRFLEDEGVAEVIEGSDSTLDCVEEAIGSCPAACIFKEE